MRLFTPLRPNPNALLARANPVAKLAAALLLMTVLFVSVDPVTPADPGRPGRLRLAVRARPARLLARTWPILLAALWWRRELPVRPAGRELFRIGPWSQRRAWTPGRLGLRVLAIAYTGVLAVATTDPTELTDSLIQQLHLSPRFAVGALAAVRLLPVMAGEWQTISLARRARGVAAGRSPLAAVQLYFGSC